MDRLPELRSGCRSPYPATVPVHKSFFYFYYGSAGAVKATRQKSLDFHSEKRFDSQLDAFIVIIGRSKEW